MNGSLRLRVVTFNIHGGKPPTGPPNLPGTAASLLPLAPDLVGLQEVHRFLPPPGVFQDQPGRLGDLLHMEVAFRPSFGVGPFGFGNAVLSRAPAERVRLTPLPSRGEPRSLLEAWLTLEGRPLRLFNTHFGLTPDQRLEQARVLAGRLGEEDVPTLVLGDLNAEPNAPEVQALLAAGLAHAAPPEIFTIPSPAPARRIDYILVSRHFQAENGRTVETQASDHLPLVADLRLP
jgi:endonuclease/exonuclease/phosphatase family metal-dependent hydrolase